MLAVQNWLQVAGPNANFQTEGMPPVQTGIGHNFVCAEYVQGKVFIVSLTGDIVWQYDDALHCNDVSVLADGNLLFHTGHGVKGVTRDKEVVWTFSDHQNIRTVSSTKLLELQTQQAEKE